MQSKRLLGQGYGAALITTLLLACASSGAVERLGAGGAPTGIFGFMRDPEAGAAVPSAPIVLERDDGDSVALVRTDSAGRFVFPPPLSGAYRLRYSVGDRRIVTNAFAIEDGQSVEVELLVSVSADPGIRRVRFTHFGPDQCREWTDLREIRGRSTGRPIVDWRWRLCNRSFDEYEVQVEFGNPTQDTIEFGYRVSDTEGRCQFEDYGPDQLAGSLRGDKTLRRGARSRHRGGRAMVRKHEFERRVFVCIYEWRVVR